MELNIKLRLAKDGKLSNRELEEVVESLSIDPSSPDAYTRLHIVALAGNANYETIVRQFLCWPEDPMMSRLAVSTLCSRWHLTEKYIESLVQLVKGVGWDSEEDVRLVAISALGEHMRGVPVPELLALLLKIFGDGSESSSVRDAAYFSLARSAGKEWSELPPASRHVESDQIDPSVLSWAYDLSTRK